MSDIELNEKQRGKLADMIIERYYRAAAARNNPAYANKTIDEWLREADERFNARQGNQRFNLTRIKAGSLYAQVQDMTINSADAPFVIKPTPMPELSNKQKQQAISILEDLLGAKLMEAGIVVMDEEGKTWPDYSAVMREDGARLVPSVKEWLKEQAKEQKATLQAEARKIATKAAKNATELMTDQMAEGNWRDTYLNCFFDILLKGTGVIRCELRNRPTLAWKGESLKMDTENLITWRHVPIEHCYPSSDSENAQDGTYFIERGAMRKQDLFDAAQIDWIKKDKIEEAFENALNNRDWLGIENTDLTYWQDDDTVTVLIHEGVVKGDVLLDWLDEDEDGAEGIKPSEFYEVEAWVLGDVVIGARVLEYPKGQRSYFSANFQKSGHGFWGIGAAMTLADLEDRLNSILNDMEDNRELTTAPPIFYNADMFEDPKHISLKKGLFIPFNADPKNPTAPPYFQAKFESKLNELVNLFNWLYRLSDDESGIPGLLSGNSDLFGGEQTFRGMKMLAASANKLIKSAFLNIDQTLIQPCMIYLWTHNMLNSDDETIKADAKIVARGASGLMQQEIADAERMDVLPILLQLIGAAGLDEATTQKIMQYLFWQTMQQGGMPVDDLMANPSAVAEQDAAVQSLQPATPLPTIGQDTNQGGLDVS